MPCPGLFVFWGAHTLKQNAYLDTYLPTYLTYLSYLPTLPIYLPSYSYTKQWITNGD